MIQPFPLLINNLYFMDNVTLLNVQQTESTKYNVSDRIVSDIQCRAEGETTGAVTHTTVNGFSHGKFSRATSHLGF